MESETETECLSEQCTEPDTEPDTSDERMVQVKPTQPPQTPPTAEEPDLVSTGAELTNWLEAHKNTGGTAKLTDNIVLDSYYFSALMQLICLLFLLTPTATRSP